ncbi:MAG TPA: hypothetical protein VKD90_27025 [Gemmataceae bacterium]|nr:hypothetical protein [Gemmataceae bacterium]
MKDVIYTDRVKQDPEEYAALQAATEILEEVSTRSGESVTAEWDKTSDPHGGPAYVLRLSDWSGSATAIFAPKNLELSNLLWARMYRLWGDLLENRSHRLSAEMASSASAGGEE